MLARSLALVGLSILGPCIGRSGTVGPSDRTVVVYVKGGDAASPGETEAMQRELDRLMTSAGYQLDLRSGARQGETVDADHLVLLTLEGACDGAPNPDNAAPGANPSLAESAVVNGHVLPFATVHCNVLSQLLRPMGRAGVPSELYWRSMGRIVAHELYHILVDEVGHDGQGVAKACFRLSDLLDEHFAFQEAALQKMRPAPAYIASKGGRPRIRQTVN